MKKLNYITILGLAAGLTFAGNAMAEEEYSYGIFDKSDNYSITDGAWKTTNKSLFQAMGDDAVLTFTVLRNDTGQSFEFGTYTYEGGQIVNGRYVVPENAKATSMKALEATITEDGKTVYTTDKFKANEVVGLYVKRGDDITYFDPHYFDEAYHQNQEIDGKSFSDFFPVVNRFGNNSDFDTWNNNEGNDPSGFYSLFYDTAHPSYQGQFYENDPDSGNQWWSPQRNDIRIQVTGYAPVPVTPAGGVSGGPLPGVWATIALAGAASAYLKRRRKENK